MLYRFYSKKKKKSVFLGKEGPISLHNDETVLSPDLLQVSIQKMNLHFA